VKRPEGFDGAQQPAGRASGPSSASGRPSRDERPARAPRPPRTPRTPPVRPAAPARPPKDRTTLEKSSRPRAARADFAAADRRRKREERAEVRRFTASARRRRLGWLAGALIALTLAAMVVAAVFSPVLALRHVVVDGTDRLDAADLVDAVDGQLGTPLALLDETRIRTELSEFPLIRSYVSELVPPDTILIHIVEREPVGLIATADGFELVDPAGVLIDTTPTQPKGYPVMQLASGDDVSGPGFRSMAEVLLALPPNVLEKVTTIAAKTKDDVTLTLSGSSQRVVWGSADHSDQKAAVLAGLVKLYKGAGAGEYDVSAPGIGVFHED
jgi:cell division protein FtsQ